MRKYKSLKLITVLQLTSALAAFLFGFYCGKVNTTKEGMPLAFLLLNFFLGNFVENCLSIFVNNYALAFVLYTFNCLTFGILGILNLIPLFFVIGFSCSYATGIIYCLFIFFESTGFLYSVLMSTSLRFEMKDKGFALCRKNISRDLFSMISIFLIASFLEVLAIKK